MALTVGVAHVANYYSRNLLVADRLVLVLIFDISSGVPRGV
jgi:hypothetical protein